MFSIKFQNCTVDIYPNHKYLVTKFNDGTSVEAIPNHTPEDYARAESLGYGDNVWGMTLDHEIGHTILAEMNGLDYSPALWAVAHPESKKHTQEEEEQFFQEEAKVLELQRFHRLMNKNILMMN